MSDAQEKTELDYFKAFVEKNKDDNDVKSYVSELNPITQDRVSAFLESDEGKKFMQPLYDRRTTKAIETWKENHIPGLSAEIENKIRQELNPKETTEQKRIRELEQKQQEMDLKVLRQTRENFAIKLANNYGIENIDDKLDMFIAEDEDKITGRMEWLKEREKLSYEKGRNSILKENAHIPQAGDDEKLPFNSLEEYGRYLKKNPDKYDSKLYESLASKART